MPFTLTHTIEIDVDGFWRLFFDAEFNRALYRDALQFSVYELVEQWTDDAGVRHQRVEYTPSFEVPAAARKLVGDGGYAEIGRFVPSRARYSAQWIPRYAPDKFVTNFELWVEPRGSRRCERVVVFENVVNMFGLRALVERLSEQSQRNMLERIAEFKNRWILHKGL